MKLSEIRSESNLTFKASPDLLRGSSIPFELFNNYKSFLDHGGSASGRALAFCPRRLGSIPRTNFSYFCLDCCSILTVCRSFSYKEAIVNIMRHLRLPFFLTILIEHCTITNECTTKSKQINN